jgi:mRNA-degrading endonuclease RelE of RelBE toxin-antitoxin system
MNLVFTKKFIRDYRKLPQRYQETADKQLALLLSNPEHPSLNVKK